MYSRPKGGFCNFTTVALDFVARALFWVSLAYVLWVNARSLFGDHFVQTMSRIAAN